MNELSEIHHKNCLNHLQKLIQCNTSNPPGNEIIAVKYLKQIFDDAEIDYKIFEPLPGRASIIARLKGNGHSKPFLMSSHLDVVPAQSASWRVDPFSGSILEDCVWGRGSVDMKNMTAMTLELLLKIKSENHELKRDVIFAAVADEEAGSHYGSKWLVDHHPEYLRAEYGVNEAGGFSVNLDGQTFYPIGVAEKGVAWLEIEFSGLSGHGSLPHEQQILNTVGQVIRNLCLNNMPFHKSPLVMDFIDQMSSHLPLTKRVLMRGLKNSLFNPWLIKLNPDRQSALKLKALFQNTVAPTQLWGSDKINVIPEVAKIGVDGRILPGSSVKEFVQELQTCIRKVTNEKFKIHVLHSQEPSMIPQGYKNSFYDSLCSTLKHRDPAGHPVPFVIPGFSDSHHYHRLGIQCYGFAPAKMPSHINFADLYHATNERLPLSALQFGLNCLWDVVSQWCLK